MNRDKESRGSVPDPDDEETVIEVGAQFGDLQLLRKLGEGSQGVVFEARQFSLDRRVAVKILPGARDLPEEKIERFRREAEAAGRLNHPNIVALHGFVEHKQHLLIVQELVTGGSLADLIDRRTHEALPADEAWCRRAADICRQIAEGLHHAHVNGVIHRDIKPGNVLMTAEGLPKIADFGLAKLENKLGLSLTGVLMGTPFYMSPEQVAAGRGGLDARTDVYSLGAVLYALLTLRVPFPGDSQQGIFLDILTRAPKAPRSLQPQIPADLEAVCLRALEKAPHDRYANAVDFARDLDCFLRGEAIAARPLTGFVRVLRRVRLLASSTLFTLVMLLPVAWFALDWGLLKPMAGKDVSLHKVRLVALGAFTLAVAWVFAQLLRRLLRGARWAMPVSVLLTVMLGGWMGARIHEEEREQLHMAARSALYVELSQDDRAALQKVEGYKTEWSSRLEADDFQLLARIYLRNTRPASAEDWGRKYTEAAPLSPVAWAVMAVTEAQLCKEGEAAAAESRMADSIATAVTSRELRHIGDIFFENGRLREARRYYENASQMPGRESDKLNLALLRVCIEQRDWPKSWDYLQSYLLLGHSHDPEAFALAVQVHDGQKKWAEADSYLAALEAASQPDDYRFVLTTRYYHLLAKGVLAEDCWRVIDEAVQAHPEDPLLVDLAASLASAAPEEKRKEDALILYSRLEALSRKPGNAGFAVKARVGLASACTRLGRFDDAKVHAKAGIDLDPKYYEAHYNLALAFLIEENNNRVILRQSGIMSDNDPWPLEVLTDALVSLQNAEECNGVQVAVLNNLAFVLQQMDNISPDPEKLSEAFRFSDRSVKLQKAGMEEVIDPSATKRSNLASALDTRSGLHEEARKRALADGQVAMAAQHQAAALADATEALANLPPGDSRYADFSEKVKSLRSAAGN